MRRHLKFKRTKEGWRYSLIVGHFPGMHKALDLIFNTTKREEEKKGEEEEKEEQEEEEEKEE